MSAFRSVCPRCRRTYGGPTRVCMVDGSPLVDEQRLAEAEGRTLDSRDASRGPPPPPPWIPAKTPPRSPALPSQRTGPPPPPPFSRPTTFPPGTFPPGTLPPRASSHEPPHDKSSGGSAFTNLSTSAGTHSSAGGHRFEETPTSAPGFERLGPYRLLRQLGEGGMARIYLAEHEKLSRICAIKRLHADHFADRLTVARFLGEARAVGAIHHPNLVTAYDVVEEPHEIYLVMEYLDGRDIAQVLRDEGPLPAARAAEIIAQACDGLAAVHAHNIIHRDLKPENIFITRLPDGSERVKLLDFGVARLLGDRPQELKTRSGLTVGTPTYMSPEQATASDIDARSDIYTIGVVLYEMLTGTPPFTGAGYGDVMLMHVNDPPPRVSTRRSDVPAWLEEVVMRCLEKEPAARFQSVEELGAALRQGAEGVPALAVLVEKTSRFARLEPPPAASSRLLMIVAIALGAVVVVAGVVAAILLGGRAAPRAAVAPHASMASPHEVVPPVAAVHVVHVAGTPVGAAVEVEGKWRCDAPCDVQLVETPGTVAVAVMAAGYTTARRMVDGSNPLPELRFALMPGPSGDPRRRPATPHRRAPSEPPPSKSADKRV